MNTTQDDSMEIPAPYQLAVAAFMALHCEEESPLYQTIMNDGLGDNAEEQKKDEYDRVQSFLQDVVMSESTSHGNGRNPRNKNHKHVKHFLANVPSRNAASSFVFYLHEAAQSLDAFMDFVATAGQALNAGTVDAYSAQGVWLRGFRCRMDQLEFDSFGALYTVFCAQVHEAESTLLDNDNNITDAASLNENRWNAVEELPARTTSTSNFMSSSEIVLPPNEDEDSPDTHMRVFQDCLARGERVAAVHALHRYMSSSRSEEILPFCSIVLAVLYSSHPNASLIQQAAQEAVRVAQQSHDAACVAFALGWLAYSSSSTLNNNNELMRRCVTRATQANLPVVAAGARLELALQDSTTDESWQEWVAATAEVSAESGDLSTRMTDAAGDHRHIHAQSQMVATVLLERAGAADLARVAATTALSVAARDDEPNYHVVVHNWSRTLLFGSGAAQADSHNVRQALQEIASPQTFNNETPCIYARALQSMQKLWQQHRSDDGVKYSVDFGLIALEWANRRGDLGQAQAILTSLQGQLSSESAVSFDLEQQRCFLWTRQGRYDVAISRLRALLDTTTAESNNRSIKPIKRVELLFQLAICYLDQEGCFADAVDVLEECLKVSGQHGLHAWRAAAEVGLAHVHVQMGDATAALSLIRSSLPTVWQSTHVWVQGYAHWVWAQALYGQNKAAAVKRLEVAASLWGDACQDLPRLLQIFQTTAQWYHEIGGHQSQRDRAALQWQSLHEALNDRRHQGDTTTDYLSGFSSREALDAWCARGTVLVQ